MLQLPESERTGSRLSKARSPGNRRLKEQANEQRPKQAGGKKPPRVDVLVETWNSYGRGIIEGIWNYQQRHGPWQLHLEVTAGDDPPILYSVSVSNLYGATNSLAAPLTVTTPYNTPTAPLTDMWNLLPGDQPYLSLYNYQRGLAYNPTTTNLVLANRNGGTSVVVLNALTGNQQNALNVAGATNGALAVDMVGVADDGVVYVGNLTTSAATAGTNRYFLYRWPNDSSSQAPAIAYAGDPGGVTYPGLRWGESIAVRGAGTNTQILLSPTLGRISSRGCAPRMAPISSRPSSRLPMPRAALRPSVSPGDREPAPCLPRAAACLCTGCNLMPPAVWDLSRLPIAPMPCR